MGDDPLSSPRTVRPLQAAFAKGAFDDLPVAVLCFVDHTLHHANGEWQAITGLDTEQSTGDGWLAAVHVDDQATVAESIAAGPTVDDVDLDIRVLAQGASDRWFRGRLRWSDEGPDAIGLLTLTAVGAHRSNEARLLHISTHDDLTGLANRARFLGIVKRSLAEHDGVAGMLFIDLDQFKLVNDRLGHRIGDSVLRAVCKRIGSVVRSPDLAARLGGDEIGVFCPQVESDEDVFALATRIGEALSAPFSIQSEIVAVGASIGVAFTSDAISTAEALIDSADRAMYVAKAAGGRRWETLSHLPTGVPNRHVDDTAVDLRRVHQEDARIGDDGDGDDDDLSSTRSSAEPIAHRLRALQAIHREHSAAVYGCAAFISGIHATKVTVDTFVRFWQGHRVTDADPAVVRTQLPTIAHRLAVHAVMSAEGGPSSSSTSEVVDAALSRARAIERTIACVQLSPRDRSVAALVVYGRSSYREVARILEQPEAKLHESLRTTLRRVRTALTFPQRALDSPVHER